jgi:quercetin dioxygenase-like cupin family protein
VPFWRRKPRVSEIDESEAYDRAYGAARRDVKIVKLPPRLPRNREVLASGDLLRRAFLDRLEARDDNESREEPMGYSLLNVEDVEGSGPGGVVKFVRRELGVEAFGVNWFEIPPNAEGREHDEAGSGQEEVNVIVRGSGVYRVDGEEVPVREGTFLRFDPETTRQPVAGPDGLTMIAIGCRRGSYEARGPF